MATPDNFDEEDSDKLTITPLGAGQEVGRSCISLKFKGKRLILDCGIHPGLRNTECLPFIDQIDDLEQTDLILISHFHLDHCGGLPHLLLKTGSKARCFMTHATKAIYRWLLADFVRVSNSAVTNEQSLYTERDIIASLDRIETIDFHQEMEIAGGIKFIAYHAGHVLGAAMFMIEIAGVKILYTGDFSRQEDRHLMCAEVPPARPDVLITEATYGTHIHDKREERESRFTRLVHDIVMRGGRCLIPAFALGRAQELMLILDEYWGNHPELHHIPIYYASQLAKKCMSVYQTYIHAMNDKVRQQQLANNNPFVFKHIANLKSMSHFEDMGPCVVMASPGMMQSGLSRELFENWCTDKRNGVIIAGYCVEGTLAKQILSLPAEVPSMSGQSLPLKCSVDYISFSAHTDYQQTSEFIRELKPNQIILVHGEQNEMMRLKGALEREYEDDLQTKITFWTPKNCESVELQFRGEKMVKVMGDLARNPPQNGQRLSGVLVKKNFSYHLLTSSQLPSYTDLATSMVTQRLSVAFIGPPSLLQFHLTLLTGGVKVIKHRGDEQVFRVFDSVDVTWEPRMVTIQWQSNPVTDMYADAVQNIILKAELQGMPWQGIPQLVNVNDAHFRHCLHRSLNDMYGPKSLNPSDIKQLDEAKSLELTVGDSVATIDFTDMKVSCDSNKKLEDLVSLTVLRLQETLLPLTIPKFT